MADATENGAADVDTPKGSLPEAQTAGEEQGPEQQGQQQQGQWRPGRLFRGW